MRDFVKRLTEIHIYNFTGILPISFPDTINFLKPAIANKKRERERERCDLQKEKTQQMIMCVALRTERTGEDHQGESFHVFISKIKTLHTVHIFHLEPFQVC